MRIALVSQTCDDETGIGRVVLTLSREFSKAGHQVHVVAQRIKGIHDEIIAHRVRSLSVYNSLDKILFRFDASKIFHRSDFDVVNTFGVGRVATVVTAGSCHLAGMQMLHPYKDQLIWSRNWGLYDRVSLSDEKFLLTSSKTKKIIAVSQLVKDQIMSYYGVEASHITVVPNGIDIPLFEEMKNDSIRASLRSSLKLTPDDFVFLFMGNEFDRKGLLTVIRSFAAMNRRSVRLLVVGAGDQRPYKRVASDLGVLSRIEFVGGVDSPERFFVAADAFVFPTLYEAFGTVVIEAMAAGIPVITSAACGAVEGLVHGQDGLYLRNLLSIDELVAAMKTLIDDQDLRRLLIQSAHTKAQNFSWERVAARTLEVYERSKSE